MAAASDADAADAMVIVLIISLVSSCSSSLSFRLAMQAPALRGYLLTHAENTHSDVAAARMRQVVPLPFGVNRRVDTSDCAPDRRSARPDLSRPKDRPTDHCLPRVPILSSVNRQQVIARRENQHLCQRAELDQ